MSRSELKRIVNPVTGFKDRLSYYTDISFNIGMLRVEDIPFKVDTGSSCTLVSLDFESMAVVGSEVNKRIDENTIIVYDASDNEIKLSSAVVDNFHLTDEIVFDKLEIFVTNDLHNKAILGMDVLSLFDFQYVQEAGQMIGSFWINNYDDAFDRYKAFRTNVGYYSPRSILSLDSSVNQQSAENDGLSSMTLF